MIEQSFAALLGTYPLLIVPGQTRPVAFRIRLGPDKGMKLALKIVYHDHASGQLSNIFISHDLTRRSIYDPHKFTFLHPSGIVSYAILRPPSALATRLLTTSDSLPVLINLHGAGLEADSELVKHSLDEMQDLAAWTLFPTGVTPWSGDDWHQWGWADVEGAISAIRLWIEAVDWGGPNVNISRWLVAGHSNGGQGTWYALTHRPDNLIAAAPVSGYSSIQKYVPYSFWRESDPRLMAIVHASMNSYRHELLAANAKHTPTLQQHGSADDNVPPCHSRRMSQLLNENGSLSEYNEVAGQGHWWQGVMTTEPLRAFYEDHLRSTKPTSKVPTNFSVVVANPADTGPKFGLQVDQLLLPGQLGRVDVSLANESMYVKTSNVRRIKLSKPSYRSGIFLVVDRQAIQPSETMSAIPIRLLRDSSGSWKASGNIHRSLSETNSIQVCDSTNELATMERTGTQLGGLDAILRSRGRFAIVICDEAATGITLQIARNLFQYFSADADIVEPSWNSENFHGNVITVGVGSNVPKGSIDHPIELGSENLVIRDDTGVKKEYNAEEHGLGAIFLRALEGERLELMVWGVDYHSLAVAARFVPLLTGVGQPDFMIVNRECLWKGVDGALAMGFFDSCWNVSKTSFLS